MLFTYFPGHLISHMHSFRIMSANYFWKFAHIQLTAYTIPCKIGTNYWSLIEGEREIVATFMSNNIPIYMSQCSLSDTGGPLYAKLVSLVIFTFTIFMHGTVLHEMQHAVCDSLKHGI